MQEIYEILKFRLNEAQCCHKDKIIKLPAGHSEINFLEGLIYFEYFGSMLEIGGRKTSRILLGYQDSLLKDVHFYFEGDQVNGLVSFVESLNTLLPENVDLRIAFITNHRTTLFNYNDRNIHRK